MYTSGRVILELPRWFSRDGQADKRVSTICKILYASSKYTFYGDQMHLRN